MTLRDNVLRYIEKSGPVSGSQIADNCSPPLKSGRGQVSRVIGKLMADGLIVRDGQMYGEYSPSLEIKQVHDGLYLTGNEDVEKPDAATRATQSTSIIPPELPTAFDNWFCNGVSEPFWRALSQEIELAFLAGYREGYRKGIKQE